ncbi:4Fe-4S dicluster domain-containing protein [Thermogladius sp.]|uniref:4Fe-4S dicluster domain-containing protein n=1 Tax=Thermogladius sp. TaxID=2023064 RepID=UPI003D0C771E
MTQTLALAVDEYAGGRFVVNVIRDRCKECEFCIAICPVKILVKGQNSNRFGYRPPVVTEPDKCIGCRLCEYVCPEFAIYVTKGGRS